MTIRKVDKFLLINVSAILSASDRNNGGPEVSKILSAWFIDTLDPLQGDARHHSMWQINISLFNLPADTVELHFLDGVLSQWAGTVLTRKGLLIMRRVNLVINVL